MLRNSNYFIYSRIPFEDIDVSHISKREEETVSVVKWHLFFRWHTIFGSKRGYHYYKRFWIPQKDQILECSFEAHIPFDRFAIKVCKVRNENAVGHLPREILSVTKFFMDGRTIVSARLTSEHYGRSPYLA